MTLSLGNSTLVPELGLASVGSQSSDRQLLFLLAVAVLCSAEDFFLEGRTELKLNQFIFVIDGK